MSLWTPFTDSLGIQHPIALAPMGGSAGGALAAAGSNGGGLGLVGGGRGDLEWLDRKLAIVANRTDKPWGIGFLAWSVDADTIRRALDYGPKTVMLSFGDPALPTALVLRAGATLLVQVSDLGEARQALDVGADIIVAQGSEAGGHGGGGRRCRSYRRRPISPRPSRCWLPGDCRRAGLAAALVLGAAGALIGTSFQTSLEALVPATITKAIIDGGGEDTERSRVLDIARDRKPRWRCRAGDGRLERVEVGAPGRQAAGSYGALDGESLRAVAMNREAVAEVLADESLGHLVKEQAALADLALPLR